MKVFITGGAGFIGSHLAESLIREGHRVLVLDDLSTGVRLIVEEAYADGFEDMMRGVPSVEKLERCIGFKPSSSLERIVEDVVAEQRELLKKNREPQRAAATP